MIGELDDIDMPISLKIVIGYIVLCSISSWYKLYQYGLEEWWIEAIYLVLLPLIAIGISLRKNIARLLLMILCALIIVTAFSFVTFSLYMGFMAVQEIDHFTIQPLIILGIGTVLVAIHVAIYLSLRSEVVRKYFRL